MIKLLKKHKNDKTGTHFYGKFSLFYQSTVPTHFNKYHYGLATINKNGI